MEATIDLPQDQASRVRLASHPDTPPTLLRQLAIDPAVMVRVAAVMNPACVASAHSILAEDADERVRSVLASRIGALLPDAPAACRASIATHVHYTLERLADDAVARVRIALAETLCRSASAPRTVILALARDHLSTVSGPILRFSPLLTDADLLELLATAPDAATARAIAQRPGLRQSISDAIVDRTEPKAVRMLLRNESAIIREATLDKLVAGAVDRPEWHEALVKRPWLPERLIQALSTVVAEQLLEVLLARKDVPAALAKELRQRLAACTAVESETEGLARLSRDHTVSEAMLLQRTADGNFKEVRLILAVASRLPLQSIDRAVSTRNGKALVSLAWRSGFSMAAARALQSGLAALAPEEMLGPAMHGAFPLCVHEMEWQLAQLGEASTLP